MALQSYCIIQIWIFLFSRLQDMINDNFKFKKWLRKGHWSNLKNGETLTIGSWRILTKPQWFLMKWYSVFQLGNFSIQTSPESFVRNTSPVFGTRILDSCIKLYSCCNHLGKGGFFSERADDAFVISSNRQTWLFSWAKILNSFSF